MVEALRISFVKQRFFLFFFFYRFQPLHYWCKHISILPSEQDMSPPTHWYSVFRLFRSCMQSSLPFPVWSVITRAPHLILGLNLVAWKLEFIKTERCWDELPCQEFLPIKLLMQCSDVCLRYSRRSRSESCIKEKPLFIYFLLRVRVDLDQSS